MLITEVELRANYQQNPTPVLQVPPTAIITPAAWQFIRDRRIKVVWEPQNKSEPISKPIFEPISRPMSKPMAEPKPKPEELTHLNAELLVAKTHPRIALRGQLDLLQCQIIHYQVQCEQSGRRDLMAELGEIAHWARGIMTAEVKGSSFEFGILLGLNEQEIHIRSHNPQAYYGLGHILPDHGQGQVVSWLNLLRSQTRICELAAARCFIQESGEVDRLDILQALNRLSSLFYVLVCRELAQAGCSRVCSELGPIKIGVSNRHVHLDQQTLEQLFGKNFSLHSARPLSQPGQFAALETVSVVGPKRVLRNVRILGPVRSRTQVELSATDTYTLGISAVVRDSGDLDCSPGVELVGPAGRVKLAEGAIVPSRHLHLSQSEAEQWNLRNGQAVDILVTGQTRLTFAGVLVRVNPAYRKELHLTTDEGNAALLTPEAEAWIVGLAK